jgi:biopolymer transport protein ExbD
MAANFGGDNDEPIASINMTPFVDIILVVLIIFMVTTPIIMKPSINVNLPKAASGEESQATELNITINAEGQILLNGEPTTNEAITAYCKNILEKKTDVQAIISADRDVSHGTVVGIIDTIKSAGVHRFAISIDRK